MGDTTSVVELHHPHDSRFSLTFITDDEMERIRKVRTLLENPDIEVAIREETVNGNQLYLLYTKTRFDAAYQSFETTEEVFEWLDEHFSDADKQILFVVIDAFDGIISEKEDDNDSVSCYSQLLELFPPSRKQRESQSGITDEGNEPLPQFALLILGFERVSPEYAAPNRYQD